MNHASVTPQHDLPDWIQRARQGVDWAALFVLILSLLAASRFLWQPGLPLTTDGDSVLFRTADMVSSFREGRLYPRWSPHALHGYGAPIPHYTPPGVAWTAAAICFIANTDPANAVRVLWMLAFLMAGLALYALVMRRVNAVAGLVTAALYLYSPYIGLTLPHITGNLAEMLGLSLALTYLWAINRLCDRNAAWDIAAVVLSGAALILTSPLHAAIALLLSLPLLTLVRRKMAFRRFALAWGLSLFISAFYWLPALLEQQDIHWLESPYLLRAGPLTLTGLLHPTRLFDPLELIPLPQLSLGTALLITTLLSVITLVILQRHLFRQQLHQLRRAWLREHPSAFQMLYLSIGFVGLLGLVGPIHSPAWLTGVLTICFSIGGTLPVHLRERFTPSQQRGLLVGAMFSLTLAATPVLFPTRPSLTINTTHAAQVQFEQQSLGIAGAAPSTAVPVTLNPSFLQDDLFVTGYDTDTINRFSSDLRDQNRASVIRDDAELHIFQVWQPTGGTVTTQIAAFAGWSAWLDDMPLLTSTEAETGLLQVVLPPTTGQTLTLVLDTTPVRVLAWVVTGAGVVMLAVWVAWRVRRETQTPYHVLVYLSLAETRLLAFVLVLTVSVVLVGYQGLGSASLRPQGWYAIRESVFLRNRSNVGLELLAYRIDQTTFRPNETIPLTLYWQTTQPLNNNYVVELSVRDVNSGSIVMTTAPQPPALYPTRRWLRGLYMRDDILLLLPAAMPAGRYVIAVKAYPCDRECRPEAALSFFDASGQLIGTLLTLPQILDIAPS